MPSQTIPELIAQVDRVERQVALISEKLGLPGALTSERARGGGAAAFVRLSRSGAVQLHERRGG